MSVCAIIFNKDDNNGTIEAVESALAQVGLGLDGVYFSPNEEVYKSAISSYDHTIVIGSAAFVRSDNNVSRFDRFGNDEEKETVGFFKRKFSYIDERFVFSLCGNVDKELDEFVKEFTSDNGEISFFIRKKDRRTVVDFLIKKGCATIDIDVALKAFITKFKSEIYADDDVSVEKRFFDLMRLSKRRVRFAESMTGGNICATVVRIPGASEIVYEGLVTYDTATKYYRLGVDPATVEAHTVVSAEVACEMVESLIDENASVGISITGYAPSEYPSKNDGLCFVGVAVDDNVRVYRFVFSGDRETVIKKATQAAIFSALNLLTEKG